MREGKGNSACALLSLYTHTYVALPKSHVYRVNNKTFFYYVLPKTRSFSVCFFFVNEAK